MVIETLRIKHRYAQLDVRPAYSFSAGDINVLKPGDVAIPQCFQLLTIQNLCEIGMVLVNLDMRNAFDNVRREHHRRVCLNRPIYFVHGCNSVRQIERILFKQYCSI